MDSDSESKNVQSNFQKQWLDSFLSVMNLLRLYNIDHPNVKDKLETLFQLTLNLAGDYDGEFSISYLEGTVAINSVVVNKKAMIYRRLAEEFRQRNINSLIFTQNIDFKELCSFMELFSNKPANIIKGGGLRLMIEESGIRQIRIAGLMYANRDVMDYDSFDEDYEDERVLFAQVDESLENFESSEHGDLSDKVLTLLKDPEIAARFLNNKSQIQRTDEDILLGKLSRHWNR